jgi:thiopurine S-methyltransferase
MDAGFWRAKWERNEIGFHEPEANPLLVAHFSALSLPEGSRVFVPLCGKTRDIHWLVSRGFRIVGVEWSGIAVEQLFSELGVKPATADLGRITRHSADGIDIFAGDFFDLTRSELGPVDAIYDRAALIALPEADRERYVKRLMEITGAAPQLLICLDYDQSLVAGPPFSVAPGEVARHYADSYDVTRLASADVGLKGKCTAAETVWLLKKRLPAERASRDGEARDSREGTSEA